MGSSTSARRPGWYYGWNIVAAGCLSMVAVNGVPFSCLSLFLHQWSGEFHTPISQFLLAMTPMMLFTGLAAPVIGALADKKPARWLFAIGLIGFALICLAVSAATAAWQIMFIYAIVVPLPTGLAAAIVANSVVSRWFVKRRGLALGISSFGLSLAGIVLPPIVVAVMPDIGWRNVWRITGLVIGLIILPIVFFIMRDRPTEREGLEYVNVDGAAPAHAHAHGGGHAGGGLRTLDILKRRNFWLVLAVFLPLGCLHVGTVQNIAPMAMSKGFDQATGGMLLSFFNMAWIAATLLVGALCDRFGNRLPLILLGVSVAGGALLLALGHGLLALIAGAAFVGVGGAIWTVLPSAAAAGFGQANVGRVFGLFSLIIPIHAYAASLLAKAQETTGSYAAPLVALAIATLVGAGLVMLLMRERPKPALGGPSELNAAAPAVAETL